MGVRIIIYGVHDIWAELFQHQGHAGGLARASKARCGDGERGAFTLLAPRQPGLSPFSLQ